jgi:TetR/AcrR family transcriptional regulator, fatty acid metabolism regulator protein
MQTSQSPRSLKEKQRQEREALILQVAEEVLLERGYHETSMDEIASRVGIAKGTVYLHFPSKDDLIVAIFTRDMQDFLSHIDEAINAQSSPKAKLEALYHLMYADFFYKRTQLFSTLYYSVDMRHLFAEKGNCMHDQWKIVTSHIARLLDEGKAAGEFNPDLPTNIMTSAFISLLSPKSYEHLITEANIPLEDVIAYAEKIYFRGIAADG